MRSLRHAAILAAGLALLTAPALAQDKTIELKIAHWVPPAHPLQKALEEWGASVEKASHATMATFMTQLGATNVNAAAPEVRDVIERGVAEAVTFPWGSIPLFGIDKVTKYHADYPFYVTTFAFVFNKSTYNQMSAAQKKVIDDHCTNEWAGKVSG